jgi:hypothetical protein
MAVVSELHAELMSSSCLRPEFQPRQAAVFSLLLKMQQRLTRSIRFTIRNFHAAEVRIFSQPILQ